MLVGKLRKKYKGLNAKNSTNKDNINNIDIQYHEATSNMKLEFSLLLKNTIYSKAYTHLCFLVYCILS